MLLELGLAALLAATETVLGLKCESGAPDPQPEVSRSEAEGLLKDWCCDLSLEVAVDLLGPL